MKKIYFSKLVRKISLLLLVFLLTGLFLSGCIGGSRATIGGWSGGTISDSTLFIGSMEGKLVAVNITDSSLLWTASLPSPVSGGNALGCATTSTPVAMYGSPVVVKQETEDLIYVGGYIPVSGGGTGRVFAYNMDRAEPSWLYPKQGVLDGGIIGGLVLSEGRIYFGTSDGKVYALEAEGLFEVWQFQTGDKIWSTPAVDGDTLYIGSFDKKLYALNTADGSKKWEFAAGGSIVTTPVVYDNTVYFGSFDRYLYALNASDGSLRWKFMAKNWFWANAEVYNGVVYAACLDGKVYALDAENGDVQMEFDLGDPISSSPVLVDDLLVVATETGVIYTLDTSDFQQRQLLDLAEKVYAQLAASQGKVYVHTTTDALYEIDARSGAKRQLSIK
jgi:outer membrane protein assembly factor BamB